MRNLQLKMVLLVATLILGCFGFAWSEDYQAPGLSPRPQCEQSQLLFGMCFNKNMDGAIQETESKTFKDDFQDVVRQAEHYLEGIAPAPNKVVITDLDETLVNNTPYYKRYKAFQPDTWETWLKDSKPNPFNPAVLDLLKNAKQRGFSVMFITGRPSFQGHNTLEQLATGFQWDGIYLKPRGIQISATQYKASVRQMLRNMGYEIVMTIGDQPSDLDQPISPAHGQFLLPNVMYSIP